MDEKYPEHAKLRSVAPYSQKIGEFLEWLGEQGISLCEWSETHGERFPINKDVRTLLAQYFEIDQKKIDAEKDAMLEEIRRSHKT